MSGPRSDLPASHQEEGPILVRRGQSAIRFDVDSWKWEPYAEDAGSRTMAEMANALILGWEYSPADGPPGHYVAVVVAERLHGEASYPRTHPDPDTIY